MLVKIEDTLNKRCLIGLSYFNKQGEMVKQNMLAGVVKLVDKELGITLELLNDSNEKADLNKKTKTAEFLIPAILSCWFVAPKGEYHTSHEKIKITDPDYLITWDIHQTKAQTKAQTNSQDEGAKTDQEHQWWEWIPRTVKPNVG